MRLPLVALCLALSFTPAAAQTLEDGFEAYDAGDYATAKTILLPLAEAGDARAMNRIGYMYDFGKGFLKNKASACDWYEKAASKGFVGAQSNVSLCFQYGLGRPLNINVAIFWAEQAAAQGDVDNQVELIRLYHGRNQEKARFWGQKAADAGSIPGRGMMDGYGLPYTGPRISSFEKYCYLFFVGVIGKPRGYCDNLTVSRLFGMNRPPDP